MICLEIIKELIKAGANVNIQDKSGRTALMYAKANEDMEVIKHLENRDI